MSYNYRYHQQGVGHIKRQHELRQNAGVSTDFIWIGEFFRLIFRLAFKLLGGLVKIALLLLFFAFLFQNGFPQF